MYLNNLNINIKYFQKYLIIGVLSVSFEISIRFFLLLFFSQEALITLISAFLGIFIMFYLNIKINFKIIKTELLKTFLFFTFISYLSLATQFYFRENFLDEFDNYNLTRVLTSSIFFIFFYFIHKKISFKNFKKVGLALYPNDDLDIINTFQQVKNYPDYIHIDIIDHTFTENPMEVRIKKIIDIKKTWPKMEIHAHIMSETPTTYLRNSFSDYFDYIIIHYEIADDILMTLDRIKKMKKKVGIAIKSNTEIKKIIPFLDKIDVVLILSINKPGKSGQKFIESNMVKIYDLKKYQKNLNFSICVDGGVSTNNINEIESEYIVSSSSILKSDNILKTINKLKIVF